MGVSAAGDQRTAGTADRHTSRRTPPWGTARRRPRPAAASRDATAGRVDGAAGPSAPGSGAGRREGTGVPGRAREAAAGVGRATRAAGGAGLRSRREAGNRAGRAGSRCARRGPTDCWARRTDTRQLCELTGVERRTPSAKMAQNDPRRAREAEDARAARAPGTRTCVQTARRWLRPSGPWVPTPRASLR